jgi:hypothetical protein
LVRILLEGEKKPLRKKRASPKKVKSSASTSLAGLKKSRP